MPRFDTTPNYFIPHQASHTSRLLTMVHFYHINKCLQLHCTLESFYLLCATYTVDLPNQNYRLDLAMIL